MTDNGNPSAFERLARRPPADDEGPRGWLWATSAFLGAMTVFVGVDLASDAASGSDLAHLLVEGAIMVAGVVGTAVIGAQLLRVRRRARQLSRDLDLTRAEMDRFRAESRDALRGLAEAIDRQFDRWALTPAEREVGLLLLKGLALKDVAAARETSERTVRQQALAVYRKAGLAGRAELAAFFLEDLLLPAAAGGQGPPAEVAQPGTGR
jgi:DNA-binding CsgD family transcriptional regulator